MPAAPHAPEPAAARTRARAGAGLAARCSALSLMVALYAILITSAQAAPELPPLGADLRGSVRHAQPAEPRGELLGPLAGPLQAAGWRLLPRRGGPLAVGDVLDLADLSLQAQGSACFPGLDRAGAGLDEQLSGALSAAARFGLAGPQIGASASLRAKLTAPAVSERAVTELRATEACVADLLTLARAGAPLEGLVVVQSVLTADLEVSRCASASAAAPGGALQAEAEGCQAVSAERLPVAARFVPLRVPLEAAGVVLLRPEPPTPTAKGKKPKLPKGQPCWSVMPCDPFPLSRYIAAHGVASSLGAADKAAKEALLLSIAPLESREALRARRAGVAPLPSLLRGAAQIVDRAQVGPQSFSLAAIERAPTAARLRAELAQLQAALAEPLPADPLARLAAARARLSVGAALSLREAELQFIEGVARPPSRREASLSAEIDAALGALSVVVSGGPGVEALRAELALLGLPVLEAGPAALDLRLTEQVVKGKAEGFDTLHLRLRAELWASGRLTRAFEAEARGGGADAGRALSVARAQALVELNSALRAFFTQPSPEGAR